MCPYANGVSQSYTHHTSFECSVPYGIIAIDDDAVDGCESLIGGVHTFEHRRHLLAAKLYKGTLLNGGCDDGYLRHRIQCLNTLVVKLQCFALGRCDAQFGIQLGEHLFYRFAKAVHHAQHANHCRRDHSHRQARYARDDVDSVLTFLRYQVSPCYVRLDTHVYCLSSSSICSIRWMVSSAKNRSSGMMRS